MNHTSLLAIGLLLALAMIGASCAGETTPIDGSNTSVPSIVTPGDPLAGASAYRAVCATCHGVDLRGVAGLGRSLVPSPYVTDKSDDDLVAFIVKGRPIDHPDNITGVAMLPSGGNPSLRDQDIANIVAYIKAQQ